MIMEINKAEESFKAKLSTRLIEAEEKGYREGYWKGYREGQQEVRLKWERVARENTLKMLKDQIPVEKIVEYSLLDLEAIKKLKDTHIDQC
ncbi:MAG: hypothetical protein L0M04_14760 [Enterococcus sp.]|uniref:hypothetical protein n=1 Tax=Enterococcus sp. TaxID=35783 RepID=UPI00264A03CC|nr:hypothetical protein [Enterococcus sp.]MDN6002026.1 hypothetical protein [Enterococcus sp.]MDN6216322.1 hypothetical protein [Enterococcus sp.]MDN6519244.1 hypothetical protein [Enterococcus sp.]MDN6562246.1 hypothetical protein [Enterococcus sp.]MDN6583162.1 hypothetical protein [Enterococcus sp.]